MPLASQVSASATQSSQVTSSWPSIISATRIDTVWRLARSVVGGRVRWRAVLLAVPNVSEGRDPSVISTIAAAYERGGARLLDVHEDVDHHRAVHTLAARPRSLAEALVQGARE